MKKVLLTISILMLIMGGYGETKTVYADEEVLEEPSIQDYESNYTLYALNNLYYEEIIAGTQTVKAIAKLKMIYAGKVTELQQVKNSVGTITGYKKVTLAVWNVYIETRTEGLDTSYKRIIANNAFGQISWNGSGTRTYKTLGVKITEPVTYRPAMLSETDSSFSVRYSSSDAALRRLKTANSIYVQIDNNQRDYFIGQTRSLMQIVDYNTNNEITSFIDIDQGSAQYSSVFWTMDLDLPSNTPAFYAQYGSGGSGSEDGPSQEQQDQLDDQNQSIQDAQDQIKDYEELEQELLNDNADTLDDLDFTNNTQILTRPNFISTANWVKTRYEELITGTPLEAVLLLSLSVGLALYVLGRMNK